MENLIIKHKVFSDISELKEGVFLGSFKDKQYLIYHFEPKSERFKQYLFSFKKIASTGVKSPKLFIIDKKNGYIVREYIDGVLMSNYLAENDMTDSMFELLFKNAYLAKLSHVTLNYQIDKWMLYQNELFYLSPEFDTFQKENDLVDHYLRLWFNTKEKAEFLAKNGISFDKKRIKDEYSTNKELVLIVCKYYR